MLCGVSDVSDGMIDCAQRSGIEMNENDINSRIGAVRDQVDEPNAVSNLHGESSLGIIFCAITFF
jgi:hypothetical protein